MKTHMAQVTFLHHSWRLWPSILTWLGCLLLCVACDLTGYTVDSGGNLDDVQVRFIDHEGNTRVRSSSRSIPLANREFLERQRQYAIQAQHYDRTKQPVVMKHNNLPNDQANRNSLGDGIAVTPMEGVEEVLDSKELAPAVSTTPTKSKDTVISVAVPDQSTSEEEIRPISRNMVRYNEIFTKDVQPEKSVVATSNLGAGDTYGVQLLQGQWDEAGTLVGAKPAHNTPKKLTNDSSKLQNTADGSTKKSTKQTIRKTTASGSVSSKPSSSKSRQTSATANNNGRYYIQAGSFKSLASAKKKLAEFKNIEYHVTIKTYNNLGVHRVMIGPFVNRRTADQALEEVIAKGHFDVFVKLDTND